VNTRVLSALADREHTRSKRSYRANLCQSAYRVRALFQVYSLFSFHAGAHGGRVATRELSSTCEMGKLRGL